MGSYGTNMINIGCVILLVTDFNDAAMYACRTAADILLEKGRALSYTFLVAVYAYSRLVLFPIIVYLGLTEDCLIYDSPYPIRLIGQMLFLLQCLNIYWFYTIVLVWISFVGQWMRKLKKGGNRSAKK